jgi:hypothetical protein
VRSASAGQLANKTTSQHIDQFVLLLLLLLPHCLLSSGV